MKKLTYKNKTLSLIEWSRYLGLSRYAFYLRLKKYPNNPELIFSPYYLDDPVKEKTIKQLKEGNS